MFRVYSYYMKKIFRSKITIFWGLAFPIILGTLFYFAFSNIYSQSSSKAMKVAVVGENAKEHPFVKVLEELEYDDGRKMIDITYADEAEAMRLLEADSDMDPVAKAVFGQSPDKEEEKDGSKTKRVIGVIRLQNEQDVTLTIGENDMYQSILSGIVSAYRSKADLIKDSASRGQEAVAKAVQSVSEDVEYVANQGMAGENKDPYIAYFYNLIAMMCMLGSTTILDLVVSQQPNSSDTGLRIGASGVSKLKFEAGVVLAGVSYQLFCLGIALVFLLGILGLNFGVSVPMILLTSVLGVLLGTALGFFVAHIGRFKYSIKNTILLLITLGGGALSGLYAVQIKGTIEASAPIINRINPMSVITDAFYSLNIFGTGDRFYRAVFTMLGMTAGLFLLGTLLSRRNQYESL